MTPWYYMCFHVATVLQELLALRLFSVSDTILENTIQPCCSIAIKNADYHTQCWMLTSAWSKTWWLTCFSGCTGVHSGPLYIHTYTIRFEVHIVLKIKRGNIPIHAVLLIT